MNIIRILLLVLATCVFIAASLADKTPLITPTFETEPSPYPEDSVDDIAIWPHPLYANHSLIIATVKASNVRPVQPTGLMVFDLSGTQKQFLKGGTPNNVDLRAGFPFPEGAAPIIGTGHWWSNDVSFYRIDPNSLMLESVSPNFNTGLEKLQGFCLSYQTGSQSFSYIVVGKQGEIEQYQLISANDGSLSTKLQSSFKLESQSEGCVVDDALGYLYVSEENKGIWRFEADDEGLYSLNTGNPILIDRIGSSTGLAPDVEGLAIYPTSTSTGYLIASSQQLSQYFVYDRQTGTFITKFSVTSGDLIDGTSHTDGLEVSATAYNPIFPKGVLIVQDNDNVDGRTLKNQNFKIIDWSPIQHLIDQANTATH